MQSQDNKLYNDLINTKSTKNKKSIKNIKSTKKNYLIGGADQINNIEQRLSQLFELTLKLKEENEKLTKLLGSCVVEGSTTKNELKVLEKSLRFGTTDLVDASIGMQIDPKILVPITGSDLSQELIDILNLISISDVSKSSSNTHIVGSFRWKAHKYPGDIDMMEIFKVNADNENEAARLIKKELQKMANDIQLNQQVRLADFKSGVDIRFEGLIKSMGTLQRDYVLVDMIEYFEKDIPNYDRKKCESELNKLVDYGALDIKTRDVIYKILPYDKMTGKYYFEIYKLIRKYRLLRWSLNDIIQGYKIKPSFNTAPPFVIQLEDAIKHKTATKIDIWTKIGIRWTEVTNFFVFQYTKNGSYKIEPLGYTFDKGIDEAIALDIMFYSSPGHEKNPKLAKRIWNRAVTHVSKCLKDNIVNYDCIDPTQWFILKKIYPIFSSDINKISQIVGDIELFGNALDKRKELNISYNFMFKDLLTSLESIPESIFRILHLGLNDKEMEAIGNSIKLAIDHIFKTIKAKTNVDDYRLITDLKWDEYLNNENTHIIQHYLETIENILKKKQDDYIKQFLIANKLHPGYNGNIIKFDYTWNYLNLPKVTKL